MVKKGLDRLLKFIKQEQVGRELMQEENQFAPNHERVFGSIGRVDFNFEGNKLTISGGGVLLGGWFYKLEGEASFTIKGATRYLCVMVDKYEGGAPKFQVEKNWQGDSDEYYIVTVLMIKSTTGGVITKVDNIGGNLPEVYNLLDKAIRSNNNKIKNTDATVADTNTKVSSIDTSLSGLDTKIKATDTKVASINTELNSTKSKVEAVHTGLGKTNTKVSSIDMSLSGLDTKIKATDTKVASINTELTNTKTKVNTLNTGLGNTNTKVSSIDTRVSGLDTKIKATDTKVTSINTELNSTKSRVEAVNTGLGKTNTKVSSIDTSVTGLDTKIKATDTKVRSTANKVQTLDRTLQEMRLYKHVINLQFTLKGYNWVPKTIALNFVTYSKRSNKFMHSYSVYNSAPSSLIGDICDVVCEGMSSGYSVRMAATGCFNHMWDNKQEGAAIVGIECIINDKTGLGLTYVYSKGWNVIAVYVSGEGTIKEVTWCSEQITRVL